MKCIRNKSEIRNLTDSKIWGKISKNLFDLPIVTHFEKDSGAFITSSLVIAKDKETGYSESFNSSTVEVGQKENGHKNGRRETSP